MLYFDREPIESGGDEERGSHRILSSSQPFEEVSETMKFLNDRGLDVFIGIVLGATIGLHYPLDSMKLLLVILSVVGVLRLAVK